ncbi:MAG: PRC-barrel domain-containing protein [Treponemataceae bacterium]
MLYKAKTLEGYTLDSFDGEIGKVKDFYFDDKHWTIRYLIADTGNWISGRQVLISPHALGPASIKEQHIVVDLTKKQIEESPPLESDKPVSKQFEEAYYEYYNWPAYWSGTFLWGAYPNISHTPAQAKKIAQIERTWDPNLRSIRSVTGHVIEATNGTIGRVDDFLVDDETWVIRYLIVDTQEWWLGKKVLVSPRWIDKISWEESKVVVSLSLEAIRQSPEYIEGEPVTREYETGLYQHYDQDGYWV